jgi:hypothetical protein
MMHDIESPNATLRFAFSWKNFVKKNRQKNYFKKNSEIFREIFFSNFFWLSVLCSQFGVCLQKFGGSRPAGLGGDRDCTGQVRA